MAEKVFKPQVKDTDGTMVDIKIPSTSVDGIDNYALKTHTHTKADITDLDASSGGSVTSVDGLSGGTITSDVTVSGAISLSGVLTSSNNSFIVAGNEFNFVPDGFSNMVHFNYRTGQTRQTCSVSSYKFCNGSDGLANIEAGNVYASSDGRLKKDIEDIKFDTENIIDNIKVRQYHWKKDDKQLLNVGCIAQELQEILPDDIKNFIVNVSDDEQKTLSVNDSKLVYILIDAYQKEKVKRVALEERLKKIEERLGL